MQNHIGTGPIHQIVSAHFRDQIQKHRRMGTHAADFLQFRCRRFQHLGQRAEMLQQPMGQQIRIPLGDAIEQQKLQNLYFTEMIQTFLTKAFLHPLTMSFVN